MGFRTPAPRPGKLSWVAPFRHRFLRALVASASVLCGACAVVFVSYRLPIFRAVDRRVAETASLLGTVLFAGVAVVLYSLLSWAGTVGRLGVEALRRSAPRSLLEILPDAVMVHEQGLFTYLNPAARRCSVPDSPRRCSGRPSSTG